MDSRIYQAALDKFSKIGQKTFVREINRGEYMRERDPFRLNEKASLRDGGTIKIEGAVGDSETRDVEDRLGKLEDLRSKGLISDEEYKKARADILSDL